MQERLQAKRRDSVAYTVRMMVTESTDRIWMYEDFVGLEAGAVSQALSRLAKEGIVRRIRKGAYYRPRQTVVGESKAPSVVLVSKLLAPGARPTGLTAAQALGLTTQIPAEPSYAITKSNAPSNLPGVRLKVRRPIIGKEIDTRQAAILELLRDRGQTSELSSKETIRRLVTMIRNPSVFSKLAETALNEPPRVRAILGALGEEAGMDGSALESLRKSLNSLSRYDFGRFSTLRTAKEWQSK